MKDLTFAIIGSGFMGDVLARVSHELPYTQCIAAADLDQDRAIKMTNNYGETPYTDFYQMLENETPDAVIVATPEFAHKDAVVRRSAKRMPCVCRKAFCDNPGRCGRDDYGLQCCRGKINDGTYSAI